MEIIQRDALYICGYAVETDAEHNQADLAALYRDFVGSSRESALRSLPGSQKGYYGLMWYTQGHEKYGYLLGIAVGEECAPPPGSAFKSVPPTTYAVSRYPQNKDAIEAWSEFFFTDIPAAGYAPNEGLNAYFEYFPKSTEGAYELWVPVIKADA